LKYNKFHILTAEVNEIKPDIVVITESWFKQIHRKEMFDIDNYPQFRCDRTKRGVGVGLYIQYRLLSLFVSKFEFI
jgi:hypothetical protein